MRLIAPWLRHLTGKTLVLMALSAVLLVSCSTIVSSPSNDRPENLLIAKVTRVIDGDTVEVELESGKEETVRFILVDTPESKGKYAGEPQPFGKEAEAFTKQHLEGKSVGLEVGVEERDRFGRLLAYIWVDDTMFNEILLREGLARVAVYPPNTKYVDHFRDIENQAKLEEKNIWSVENYVSEDGYEDNVTYEETENPGSSNSPQSNVQDLDCSDFSNWEEAQAFFKETGSGDPFRLDGDGDGIACDSIR
ncbi:MAG TPA: thermonuclease family protein [Bacillus sp. (in: firmicutes)]|uniref:thermonuclease family protein n=1 Tax=Bacillus litorisediminis TaxID=2922713 RepID=UPI001FAD0A5D|nr:thermonuclease family protein [Bacillus litorisediminis]HWO77358.1 thermonuclease family protein [Bacillus sp. (in: firmicutes)]